MSASFSIGDLVCVGKSIYPAKIVAFFDESVEVKWLDSGATNWSKVHPITSIQPLGGRRRRTQTNRFTMVTVKTEEEETNGTTKRKRGRRPPKKRGKSTPSKAAAKKKNSAYRPKKLRAIKVEEQSSPPAKKPPASSPLKRKTAAKSTKRTTTTSVAQRPPPSSNDDSSDEELIARARRVSQGKIMSYKSGSYNNASSSDDDDDDDRKPAAKAEATSIAALFSSSSDSSNDEITRARVRKKVAAGKHQEQDSPSDSREDEPAAKTRRTRARRLRPQKAPTSSDESDGDDESISSAGESESETSGNASQQNNGNAVVKTEQAAAPLQRILVGDHVWIQDGKKSQHPAVVIGLVDNDMLAVKWGSGSTANNIVSRSAASRMFDLTQDNANDGRPRRSTRARRKPEPLLAIKKEPSSSKVTVKREARARAAKLKTKKATGKPKTKSGRRKTTRKKSKKKPVIEIDSDTDESDIALTKYPDTTALHPVVLDSSSDSDSDAGSLVTEATFEYTAPHIDPQFRSLHRINTDLEAFMTVESWTKVPNVARVSRDEQDETEASARAGDGSSDVEVSPPPAKMSHSDGARVLESEKDLLVSNDSSRFLQETSLRVNEKDVEDGDDCPPLPSGIEESALNLDYLDEDPGRRESTETASPDDLSGILLQGDAEPTANEERLTADSQELTRTFAAFGDGDLSTQPEAMCM